MGSTQTHFSEDKTETQRDEEIYGVWNEHKFGIKPRLPDSHSLGHLLYTEIYGGYKDIGALPSWRLQSGQR